MFFALNMGKQLFCVKSWKSMGVLESDVESDATVALARLLAAKLAAAALPKMSRTLTVMLPPLRVNSAEVAEG